MKTLIIFFFLISTMYCFADFVDVATIKVNNETVRKITRNKQSPYSISFTNFKPGDTLSLSIWTDHGGEKNAYFSFINLITGNSDTLEKSNRIILTESLINEPHLFSVTLVYQVRSNAFSSKWEMFKTTQNAQIEDIYSSLNNFVSILWDFNNSKIKVDPIKEFLLDSVTFNYTPKYAKNTLDRELQPKLITVHKSKTPDFLRLSQLELDYFDNFNSKDYVQLYNLGSDFYGNITIADDLNTFEFYLRNFLDEELIFKFIRKNDSFLLKEVSYEKSTPK